MAEMDHPVAGPNGISGHCSNLVVLEDGKQTAELWDVCVFLALALCAG